VKACPRAAILRFSGSLSGGFILAVLEVANGTRTAGPGERWVYSGAGPGDLAPKLEKAGTVELKEGKTRLVLPPVSLTVVDF